MYPNEAERVNYKTVMMISKWKKQFSDGSFEPVVVQNSGYTGLESRPGRMLVIDVVHIQCCELFKDLECTVPCMVLLMNKLKSSLHPRPL